MTPTVTAIIRHARALGWSNPRIATYLAPALGYTPDPGTVAKWAMRAGCEKRGHRGGTPRTPAETEARVLTWLAEWRRARERGLPVCSWVALARALRIPRSTTYAVEARAT